MTLDDQEKPRLPEPPPDENGMVPGPFGGKLNRKGRPKGVVDRRLLTPELILAGRKDPLIGLSEIAENPETPVAVRAECFATLAKYLYPAKKALEIRAATDVPHAVHVEIVGPDVPALLSGPAPALASAPPVPQDASDDATPDQDTPGA